MSSTCTPVIPGPKQNYPGISSVSCLFTNLPPEEPSLVLGIPIFGRKEHMELIQHLWFQRDIRPLYTDSFQPEHRPRIRLHLVVDGNTTFRYYEKSNTTAGPVTDDIVHEFDSVKKLAEFSSPIQWWDELASFAHNRPNQFIEILSSPPQVNTRGETCGSAEMSDEIEKDREGTKDEQLISWLHQRYKLALGGRRYVRPPNRCPYKLPWFVHPVPPLIANKNTFPIDCKDSSTQQNHNHLLQDSEVCVNVLFELPSIIQLEATRRADWIISGDSIKLDMTLHHIHPYLFTDSKRVNEEFIDFVFPTNISKPQTNDTIAAHSIYNGQHSIPLSSLLATTLLQESLHSTTSCPFIIIAIDITDPSSVELTFWALHVLHFLINASCTFPEHITSILVVIFNPTAIDHAVVSETEVTSWFENLPLHVQFYPYVNLFRVCPLDLNVRKESAQSKPILPTRDLHAIPNSLLNLQSLIHSAKSDAQHSQPTQSATHHPSAMSDHPASATTTTTTTNSHLQLLSQQYQRALEEECNIDFISYLDKMLISQLQTHYLDKITTKWSPFSKVQRPSCPDKLVRPIMDPFQHHPFSPTPSSLLSSFLSKRQFDPTKAQNDLLNQGGSEEAAPTFSKPMPHHCPFHHNQVYLENIHIHNQLTPSNSQPSTNASTKTSSDTTKEQPFTRFDLPYSTKSKLYQSVPVNHHCSTLDIVLVQGEVISTTFRKRKWRPAIVSEKLGTDEFHFITAQSISKTLINPIDPVSTQTAATVTNTPSVSTTTSNVSNSNPTPTSISLLPSKSSFSFARQFTKVAVGAESGSLLTRPDLDRTQGVTIDHFEKCAVEPIAEYTLPSLPNRIQPASSSQPPDLNSNSPQLDGKTTVYSSNSHPTHYYSTTYLDQQSLHPDVLSSYPTHISEQLHQIQQFSPDSTQSRSMNDVAHAPEVHHHRAKLTPYNPSVQSNLPHNTLLFCTVISLETFQHYVNMIQLARESAFKQSMFSFRSFARLFSSSKCSYPFRYTNMRKDNPYAMTGQSSITAPPKPTNPMSITRCIVDTPLAPFSQDIIHNLPKHFNLNELLGPFSILTELHGQWHSIGYQYAPHFYIIVDDHGDPPPTTQSDVNNSKKNKDDEHDENDTQAPPIVSLEDTSKLDLKTSSYVDGNRFPSLSKQTAMMNTYLSHTSTPVCHKPPQAMTNSLHYAFIKSDQLKQVLVEACMMAISMRMDRYEIYQPF